MADFSLTILIASTVAGLLTILAPCILPLLPIVVGGGMTSDGKRKLKKPLIITLSLGASIFLFTLILKLSTTFIGFGETALLTIAGIIIIGLGLSFLFPHAWDRLLALLRIRANIKTNAEQGTLRDVLTGASLGPVFNSCSPTYLFIVAIILPTSLALGLIYLAAYTLGLMVALLLITFGAGSIIAKLGWAVNPDGIFRKIIGALFVVVGLAVIFGLDKAFQTFVLDQGWYDWVAELEERLR